MAVAVLPGNSLQRYFGELSIRQPTVILEARYGLVKETVGLPVAGDVPQMEL